MSSLPEVPWQCPPKTVLVAVDFGDASARALAIGGVVASAFDARLRALHAERFEPPPYFTLAQIAGLEAERRVGQAAATDHLARFAAEASAYRVESLVVDEPAVEAILSGAATADLIIAGTHGRRGPGRWWLGSVAERVVHAATIPVLVTRAAATAPARGLRAHCVRAGRKQCRVGRTHLRRAPRDHWRAAASSKGGRSRSAKPVSCSGLRWSSWRPAATVRHRESPIRSPRSLALVSGPCCSFRYVETQV